MVDNQIIIRSHVESILDLDNILFFRNTLAGSSDDMECLGKIDDVFGSIK